MPNMREIKLRMKSIDETMQITKAMKLISAAKLKKARKQLDSALPFFEKVIFTMSDIMIHSADINSIYFKSRFKYAKKRAYIIFSGDKGLAGGYNSNIIKLAQKHIGDDKLAPLLVAGHMGKSYFQKHGYNVFREFEFPVQNPTVYRAREISEVVIDLFKSQQVHEFYLLYTDMVNSMTLEPKILKLLPLDRDVLWKELLDYKDAVPERDETLNYEPSPKFVFDVLVPKYIKGIIYGALVESFTSEQSSRMTAMDSATNNAKDMLGVLTLNYNRARQSAITQEISEIVGGAAALD